MDEQATGRETFKFSEVLSALSFVLDMVEGQPEGHVVRSCFVGMTIGESLGLSPDQRSALFYALLLKDAGCSSTSSGVAALFEADDFEVKKILKTTDRSRLPESRLYVAHREPGREPPYQGPTFPDGRDGGAEGQPPARPDPL